MVGSGQASRIAALAATLFVVLGIAGSAFATTSKKPTFRNFLPRAGTTGTVLTITGTNFSGATAVKVDGLKTAYTVRSSTRITATVPSAAKDGRVSVTTAKGTATSTGIYTVTSANGSGTLTTGVTSVSPGESGDLIAFTYTAASPGMFDGVVTITVPAGWTPPVTSNAKGCVTVGGGTVSTNGQVITVSGLTLPSNGTVAITYGATSGGACTATDGATSPTTGGASLFQAAERSWSTGKLTNLAASPTINVAGTNGAGTLTTPVSSVGPGENGDVLGFTYTAAAGGMTAGSLTITVPSGWTAPTTSNAPGCTTASAGTVSVSGQVITVSALTLASSGTVTITYGAVSGGSCTSADGATSPSSAGTSTFAAQQAGTSGGMLTALAASPSITVT
jgi:hypothetical protein